MNLEKLAEVVENMIIQHDYPGFEPRALLLGLPDEVTKAPAKVFGDGLRHENVFVRLASLRWFQERPGLARSYMIKVVLPMLKDVDPYVRMETIRLIERATEPNQEMVLQISPLLQDENPEVQRWAARALGKLCKKLKIKDQTIIESLQVAAAAPDSQLRGKAEKALRKIGVYD
ncbi:MAG: HEAT repeat domain-containing protein [Candidatus Melainabacteria bacterium]|nr:HEAT repeat domain-containing protein [Candidatus Melainabacteria bacterium]